MPVASWLQAIKDWVPKKVNLSNCTRERDPERDLVHLSERLDSLNHRLDRAAKVLYPTDFRQQKAEADRMPLTVNSLPVTPRERKHSGRNLVHREVKPYETSERQDTEPQRFHIGDSLGDTVLS